jgi:hypothetical protein
MKSVKKIWLPLLLLCALVGGFGYVAVSDVSVSQTMVEKPIANDRFMR